MAFKSDNHRKWFFSNLDSLLTNEGVIFETPTKVGFDSDTKNRLMNEEMLILDLQNARSKNK